MTVQKILFSKFGNGHRENIIFTIDSGESVTCHFGKHASDVDTASDKYFDLRDTAKRVNILPDLAATMTHIGGIALKSPRTLTVGGTSFREGIEWSSITVRADSDSTTFEIYAS